MEVNGRGNPYCTSHITARKKETAFKQLQYERVGLNLLPDKTVAFYYIFFF